MATFAELDSLIQLDETTGLRRRVAMATLAAANAIRLESETPVPQQSERKRFAQQILKTQLGTNHFLRNQSDRALAQNKIFEAIYRGFIISQTGTVSEIQALTDAQIQTSVDNVVTLLAKVFNDD